MNESCYFSSIAIKVPLYRGTIATLYLLAAIATIFFNALVIYSIWKTPTLHKPSYILIANLAVTDFVVGMVAEPFMIITNVSALENWTAVFCYTWIISRGVGYWMGAMSLYTLTAISVDRLLAIKLKSRYRSIVTLKRVVMILIGWWIGTCSLFFMVSSYIDKITIILSTYLFVLLGTLTICYIMSYYNLKRLSSPVSPNTTTEETRNNTSNFHVSKYRRSLNTTLIVFLTIMLFYFPCFCSLVTTAVIFKVVPNASESRFRIFMYKFITASELVVFVNSTMNPFLYLWRMQELRQAAKATLKKILRWKTNDVGQNYIQRSEQRSQKS
jgi:hypothetical protein